MSRHKPPREITHYTHTQPDARTTIGYDTRVGYYYVAMLEGRRPRFALGPFPTHERAAEYVKPVMEFCIDQDPKNHFEVFGVARIPPGVVEKLPEPPINQYRPEWAPTAEDRAALPANVAPPTPDEP